MKPVSFDYYAPTSVEEALDKLNELGYGGKVLGGGQSLIAAMNFRMARPPALVDLSKISALSFIRQTNNGALSIGTMTTDTEVEQNPMVKKHAPIIVECMPFIAHPQVRNRGTFGGAIAHADPAGQLPGVVLALNGRVLIKKKGSERWVDLKDLFIGPFMTVIEPEEMLAEVVIPALPPHSGTCYKQVARQHGAQFQTAVAVVVTMDKNRCKAANIVLMGVGEMPTLSQKAASVLVGQEMTEAVIEKAAEAAMGDADPGTDIHATAEYRFYLVKTLVSQALTEAVRRAKGG